MNFPSVLVCDLTNLLYILALKTAEIVSYWRLQCTIVEQGTILRSFQFLLSWSRSLWSSIRFHIHPCSLRNPLSLGKWDILSFTLLTLQKSQMMKDPKVFVLQFPKSHVYTMAFFTGGRLISYNKTTLNFIVTSTS